ncbi:2,3-diketo-L-gulonate TRAP transporter small permease protein yiaM [Bhargavaea cecembensis DSE10]|uniref:2,3-diketo-L-gulonate TRAP transporter small permease protein yiaM n=1 Tax=Bhargavaea cecembensis DSE10 TaxID=1235279 RepID=M7NIG2_9BACL|nr:TRAP transporter small permease [Bhargavaea cecembensis]EMR07042.1 2,3-diketo-L-gulonate TRAP transporter small permease protein yiaM [Bhargavaea cecembensis DSE10]
MEKLATILAKLLSYLCIIALASLSAIVLIQVISRFFDVSLPATEELARLLIVWLTFLGTALAIHEKMHLGVRYFVSLASERYQRIIDTFIYVLVAVLLAILVFYGFSLSMTAMTSASATMRMPMGIFYLAIPVSSLFSLYFTIMHIVKPNHAEQREASL